MSAKFFHGRWLALLPSACFLFVGIGMASAIHGFAAEGREFRGLFGDMAQPGFVRDEGLAVEPATGDLLVIDVGGAQKSVSKFAPDGQGAPFTALGTNVIDGKLGPGGEPCAEESQSCDLTPTPPNGGVLGSINLGPKEVQVAVAPPGSAASTAGNIYVTNGQARVVDIFGSNGAYVGQLTKAGAIDFGEVCGVAVDPFGAVYVADFNGKVHKFVPSSDPPVNTDHVASFSATEPCGLAAGLGATAGFVFVNSWESGTLTKIDATTGESKYVVDTGNTTAVVDPQTGHLLVAKGSQVVEYDASGAVGAIALSAIDAGSSIEGIAASGADHPEGANVYVARASAPFIDVYGQFGPLRPTVKGEFVKDVGLTTASIRVDVNPRESPTTVRVDYGLSSAYGESTDEVPVGADGIAHSLTLALDGLAEGATYHWRVVATSLAGVTIGSDHTFSTNKTPLPPSTIDLCQNERFRADFSMHLPDCRAYEMVSPIDKNGGEIIPGVNAYNQSALDGGKITYSAGASFADQPNSFGINQYLAFRQSDGWSNHGIHPQFTGDPTEAALYGLIREFMAFTADLCNTWLIDFQTPALTPDGQDGYRNLYRRNNCEPGGGALEALISSPPPLPDGTQTNYIENTAVQGHSEDTRHVVFVADAPLTPDARGPGGGQIYDRFEGANELVSILPDGSIGDPAEDGQGFADPSAAGVGNGWNHNLRNAVSQTGSQVYWTSNLSHLGVGRIYLRERPEQGVVSGECTEPSKACTIPVSSSGSAYFWAASNDGERALYSEGSLAEFGADLYEFDLAGSKRGEPPRAIASSVRGVAGVSDDLKRIYFVSRDALTSQSNSVGAKAVANQPNLYVADEGSVTFIATLTSKDVLADKEPGAEAIAYDVASGITRSRATRVTSDGSHIVFQSRASLTGYDNLSAANGEPAVEVYMYKLGGELFCISCNPAGVRPATREMPPPYLSPRLDIPTNAFAAAWIPTLEWPLYASNVISDDGTRIFFNSNDALLPQDTNNAQDVYEWEGPGSGTCHVANPAYFPQNGGCLYLISTGESSFESLFIDATPDGSNVFFTTESKLWHLDPGSVDLYDARVDGGFPRPVVKEPCEGEACQTAPPPPTFATPSSSVYAGPGDLKRRRPCAKGKHRVRKRGKVRCVRRGVKPRANRNRRAKR